MRSVLFLVLSARLALAGPARSAPAYVPNDSVLQRLDRGAAHQALAGWEASYPVPVGLQ